MGIQGRFAFTPEEHSLIWQKWKQGDSLSDIGREVRRHPGSVHRVIFFTMG